MFMRKIIVCLRFLGILLLRFLLGIVVAYLWLFAVAYLFHIIMNVRIPADMFDYFYDSGPPRDGRYLGMAGAIYGLAWRVGMIGAWSFITIGILWGFSQGKLDLRRLLRRRQA